MNRLVIMVLIVIITLVGCTRHIVKHEESYVSCYNPSTGMMWNSSYILDEEIK